VQKHALHTPRCITANIPEVHHSKHSKKHIWRSLLLKQHKTCNIKCFITHYIFNHNRFQSNVHCLKIVYQNVRIIRCSLPSKQVWSLSRLSVACYQRLYLLSDLHEIRLSNSSQKVVKQARVL